MRNKHLNANDNEDKSTQQFGLQSAFYRLTEAGSKVHSGDRQHESGQPNDEKWVGKRRNEEGKFVRYAKKSGKEIK